MLETWVELLEAPCPLGSFDLLSFVRSVNTAPIEEDWAVFELDVTPVADAALLPPPLDDELRCFDLPDYREEPVILWTDDDWEWEVYPGAPAWEYDMLDAEGEAEYLDQRPPVCIPTGLLEARDAHRWQSVETPEITSRAGAAGGPCYYVLDDQRTRRRWWGAACDNLWSTVWVAGPQWPRGPH